MLLKSLSLLPMFDLNSHSKRESILAAQKNTEVFQQICVRLKFRYILHTWEMLKEEVFSSGIEHDIKSFWS